MKSIKFKLVSSTYFFLIIIVVACSSGGKSSYSSSNVGNPMDGSNKYSGRSPKSINSNRYLNNNQKRKKIWTKIKIVKPGDCPTFKSYHSTSEKKLKKKLGKRKKKN